MDDLLTELDASSRALAERSTYVLSDAAMITAHDQLRIVINRLTAIDAGLVHDIDNHGIVRASGSANASTWLREHSHMSITEARKLTALGALLASRVALDTAVRDGAAFPAAGREDGHGDCREDEHGDSEAKGGADAASSSSIPFVGGVNCEQVLAIGRVLADLPKDAGIAITDKVEAALVGLAGQFEPGLLRTVGDRVLAHIAPEVADRQLRRRLEREEREAARSRSLTLSPDGLGRTRLHGILDTESAAIVNAALDPLMKPVPVPSGADRAVDPDLRSAAARRADALVEVCRLALRTGKLPVNGGQPPQIIITINATDLHDAVLPGTLDTGEAVSADALRRMACDAQVLPIVLNGARVPIDVGRARRLFTGATRTAILVRDGGCAFPGCDRPPRWCDVHHLISWIDGGPTDRDNGVSLCGYHHRYLHRQPENGWQVRMGHDGHPEFLPPIHIDPTRAPRRNPYHART